MRAKLVERQMGKAVRRRPDADQHGIAFRVEFRIRRQSEAPAPCVRGRPSARCLQRRRLVLEQHVVAEHQMEPPREIQGESHIGDTLALRRGVGVPASAAIVRRRAKLAVTLARQLQTGAARRNGARGGGRNAGTPRGFTQGKPLQAAFGEKIVGGLDQCVAQIAVMVASFGRFFFRHDGPCRIGIFTA